MQPEESRDTPQEESAEQTPTIEKDASGWKFNPGDPPPSSEAPKLAVSHDSVTWTASEYIAHHKTPGWFLGLTGCALLLSVIIFLLTRDYIATAVVPVVAIIFGVSAARPPRILNYAIDDQGVHIEAKNYAYNLFKSFSIVEEGAFHSIVLMPLKRFMPALTIYYAPEDEKRISDVLGSFLPVEEARLDAIDRLMRKIRF